MTISRRDALGLLAASPIALASTTADADHLATEYEQQGWTKVSLAERRKQLEAWRKTLTEQRARHERGEFTRMSEEHARQLEEDGLEMLQDLDKEAAFNEAAKLVAGEAAKAKYADLDEPARHEKVHLWETTVGSPVSIHGTVKAIAQAAAAHRSQSEQTADAVIAGIKTMKAPMEIPGLVGTKVYDGSTFLWGLPLTAATVARWQVSRSETDREEFRQKSLEEFSKTALAGMKLGPTWMQGAASEAGPAIALAMLNGEVYSRLAYWAAADYLARGMRSEAEATRRNAICRLDYMRMVTDWEMDQVDRRMRILEHRAHDREPGGIKIESWRADELAGALDITAATFDPASGRVVFAGRASQFAIDLDVFSTVLRLALDDNEPFFSLNPVNQVDWDNASSRVSHELAAARIPFATLAARIAAVGHVVPDDDGQYVVAAMRDVDPDVYARATGELELREEMVFSPVWLKHTRVGWIFAEADLLIKAVAAGTVENAGSVEMAPVWNIGADVGDPFRPEWSFDHHGHDAGRANFEIDDADVPHDGSTIDLSVVKPALVIKHRAPGTTLDLPECDNCRRVRDHVHRHWHAYARALPALERLGTVFRAYVAARWLVRRHPGLAARIHALDHSQPFTPEPMFNVSPLTIRMRVDATGTPVRFGQLQRYINLSSGYGGGVRPKASKAVVRARPSVAAVDAWADAGGDPRQDGWRVEKIGGEERVGVALDLTHDTIGATAQARLGGASLAGLAVSWAVARRVTADPIDPVAAGKPTCARCARVHRRAEIAGTACDVLGAGALAFMLALPIAAAWTERADLGEAFRAIATALVAVVVLTAVAGLGARGMQRLARSDAAPAGVLRCVGIGTRWSACALGIALLHRGWNGIAGALSQLAGAGVGERVAAFVGDLRPLAIASVVAIVAFGASLLARWLVPPLLGSRPLLLVRSHPTGHER